ncbi:MAG TPA: LuxR C-terminal-related transcriptional regulator [Microlunatus sp.]
MADYLYRESLMQQPDDVQRFLRRTAVLDQMCASLCEAVLGEEASQARLLGLEASSMFLISLDRRRQWYRYHALFREFLLGELRRVEPAVVTQLHRHAADWYEANGVPALALEHLLVATERDRCVRLAARLLLPTYQSGQLATLERWLATLGRPTVQAYPPLAVLAGWIAVLTGQPAEAEWWATFVDTATFDESPVDGTASFASSRAMLHALMCRAGPDRMFTDAGDAVTHEPASSGWRALALVLRAEAHLLLDDHGQAPADFLQTLDVGGRSGNVNAIILSRTELAVMAMDRGDWEEARHDIERALGVIDQHRLTDYAISALAFAAAARLAAHQDGHASSTDARMARAMRSRTTCTFVLPWLAVRVRLQLVKAYTGIADIASAQHLLREIDDIVTRRPQLGVLVGDVSRARAALRAKPGQGPSGGSLLTPAELRILPYLQTHLTFCGIGERLYVSRNTVNSEVGSICRKLGVSSRSDAVQRATTIGLLGA